MGIGHDELREYERPSLVYYGTIIERTAGSGATSCDSSHNVSPGQTGQTSGQPSGGCGDAQQTSDRNLKENIVPVAW